MKHPERALGALSSEFEWPLESWLLFGGLISDVVTVSFMIKVP